MLRDVRGNNTRRERDIEDLTAESDDKQTNNSALEQSEMVSEASGIDEGSPWISWFLSVKGNEFFCAVDEEFIQDEFNLTGLSPMVPYFSLALEIILDLELSQENLTDDEQQIIETAAEVLYGLIHARFILTSKGMAKMLEKYNNHEFGRCPRVNCQGQPGLPIGVSDYARLFAVNIYCPCCQDIYFPRSGKHAAIDGAYFGTTFAHLFLLAYPEQIPKKPEEVYLPRIYGFKISKESDYHALRLRDSKESRVEE